MSQRPRLLTPPVFLVLAGRVRAEQCEASAFDGVPNVSQACRALIATCVASSNPTSLSQWHIAVVILCVVASFVVFNLICLARALLERCRGGSAPSLHVGAVVIVPAATRSHVRFATPRNVVANHPVPAAMTPAARLEKPSAP